MSTTAEKPAGHDKAERLVLPGEIDSLLQRARTALDEASRKIDDAESRVEEADERVGNFLSMLDEHKVRLLEDAVHALEGSIGPCDLTRDLRQLAYELDDSAREFMFGSAPAA